MTRNKKRRAWLVEQEFRQRGVRTPQVVDEELRRRIDSGVLQLPVSLRASADVLAMPYTKLIEPGASDDRALRSAIPIYSDERLEPVGYDTASGSLQPYIRESSFQVPCRAKIKGQIFDPAIIEILPITDRQSAHLYFNAIDVEEITPTDLLLPEPIQRAVRDLEFPDRGLSGEGLGSHYNGMLLLVQNVEHLYSASFFKFQDIVRKQLTSGEFMTLRAEDYEKNEISGVNEILVSSVHRILALNWHD